MKKQELVDALAAKTGVSRREAEDMVAAFIELVTKELVKGGEVALTGFGTYTVSKRAARAGVNPKTGEKIQIPAVKVPKFKAGKTLKDAVR